MAESANRRADASMDCGSAELIVDFTAGAMADIFARTMAGNVGHLECGGSIDSSSELGRRFLLHISRHNSLAG